jgi:hypothetical protein
MRPHYRILATLVLSLGVASVAYAQAGSSNPSHRGGTDRDPFGAGSVTAAPRSEDFGRSNFGQHGLLRAQARTSVVAVTPVPEPGQWAMMLAGLALVGWIVRRNTKR